MTPSGNRRPALPTSFLEMNSPSSASAGSFPDATLPDTRRDLAIAVDGSFVETTSEAAARSMAKFYSGQEGERGIKVEYAVQKRVDKEGRILYRIRPVSQNSAPTASHPSTSPRSFLELSEGSLPFARPSDQPPRHAPLGNPSIAVQRDSVQSPPIDATSRLEPRMNASEQDTAQDLALLRPEMKGTSPRRQLRKAGSTPLLRMNHDSDGHPARSTQSSQLSSSASASRIDATPRSPRHPPSEGDVLGRILGWRAEVETGGRETPDRMMRKMNGAARVPLPELFTKGSSSPTKKKQQGKDSRELDTSDLPEDSVVEVLAEQAVRSEVANFDRRLNFASPFGSEVRIPREGLSSDPPSSTLQIHTSAHPRTMREVASNDSIRTAKADDPRPHLVTPQPDLSRRPRFQDPRVFDVFHAQPPPSSPPIVASTPLGQHSRFPSSSSLASSASGHSRATGQQITVHAAPGDDPRFVIWGYKETTSPLPTAISIPPSTSRRPSVAHPISPPLASNARRGSIAIEGDPSGSPSTSASGSPATTSSRRWSLSARGGGAGNGSGYASPATSLRDSVGSNPSGGTSHAQRILMAATVERLVAELTSQISVELLSDFFLTYRHYLSPLDLLHLLLTRFDWAMSPSNSSEDDALRRVVRVRTFVVLRYWLLNHFMDDFYPSKEMRSGLTEWLNASAKDPRFRENQKDARLIKNLKKTVRKCKETFVLGRPGIGGASLGTEGTAQLSERRLSEEDVDLEMIDSAALRGGAKSPPANSTSFKFGTFRSRKNSTVPVPGSSSSTPSEPAFPLPGTSQNPIAKSFATALGTFGRFKRMIGQRASSNAGLGNDEGEQEVEFEQNDMGDLLWVKGGLEKYLEYWDIGRDSPESESQSSRVLPVVKIEESIEEHDGNDVVTPKMAQSEPDDVSTTEPIPPIDSISADQVGLGILNPPPPSRPSPVPPSSEFTFPAQKVAPTPSPSPAPFLPIFDPESYENSSNLAPAPFGRPRSARIELDDLDDSDSDDEDVVEVKRTLKRLPNAHNLRLAAVAAPSTPGSFRSSLESETSYGFGSGSRLSYGGQERESVLFVDDEEGGEIGVTVIPNFILEGLLDSEDEDEPGDVEAALRRLEGLVDTSKEQEKAKKVDRQMKRSEKLELERKKQEDGEISSPSSLSGSRAPSLSSQPEEPESSVAVDTAEPESFEPLPAREAAVIEKSSVEILPVDAANQLVAFSSQTSPPITSASATVNPLDSSSRATRTPSRLGVTPAYPTIAGRKATLSRIFGGANQGRPASTLPAAITQPGPPPPTHRSFLLYCRTETLAQQFTLIERDMLRVLSYQELVSGNWKSRIGETDILDWELYLKERRKEDLAAREKGEQVMSAVQDVIARFNLMANWVVSEILLTANIDERAILIGKFIRLAFKCYCQSNFQTVMQIVHGLQIPHIERLRKTWAKVPSWEIRKLEGMQRFTSHLKNFTHLRDLMNRLAAEHSPGSTRSSLSDPVANLALKGCIPFTGLFLRDLAHNAELPTFLDPTSTNAPASVDSTGSLTSVTEPEAFESLAPLPEALDLFPLVNLHKFRKLATIVQRIRTFQSLSERYAFEPVQTVYFRCLKIRALNQNVMQELSSRIEP